MISEADADRYLNLAKYQLDRQHVSIGRLGSKIQTLLGFEFVIISLILNALVLGKIAWNLSMVPLSVLGIALLFSFKGFWARGWGNAPDIEDIRKDMASGTPFAETVLPNIETMCDKFTQNERSMAFLSWMLRCSILALATGIVSATITLVRNFR